MGRTQTYPATAEDIALFNAECAYRIDFFGIKDWEVLYKCIDLEEGIKAQCHWKREQRLAQLILNKTQCYPLTLHAVIRTLENAVRAPDFARRHPDIEARY